MYAARKPNAPTLAHLERLIRRANNIINRYIGCRPTNITHATYLADVQDLCLKMVIRQRQVELAQGQPARIPMFSPNDFLIDREREDLIDIGIVLGHRAIGEVGI